MWSCGLANINPPSVWPTAPVPTMKRQPPNSSFSLLPWPAGRQPLRLISGIPVSERPHNHRMGMPQMERAEGKLEGNSIAVQHQLDKQKSSLLQLGKDSSSIDLNNLPQLSCFGCGIGWFSFVAGFAFPLLWYYATILYFGNYHFKEPRERAGLAASAIAAMICTATVVISLTVVFSDGK